MKDRPRLAALAAIGLLSGCVEVTQSVQPFVLESVRFDRVPGWAADKQAESFAAFRSDCHRLALLPPDLALGGQGLTASFAGQAGQLAASCTAAFRLPVEDELGIRLFYETWFQPYRVHGTGLLTGYYEPEVEGSLTAGNGFAVPLLARPADLVTQPPGHDPGTPSKVGRLVAGKLVPYWTRAEIEAGFIGAFSRPLLWLHNSADLFFLQMQGSGRVKLPNGSVVRVGYDGKNGRAYTAVGEVLIAENALPSADISMQAIKAWLKAHPAEAKAVMDRNDDYVFFRLLQATDPSSGPPGALGVNLTAGRSLAVDARYFPLAMPIFVDTRDTLTGVRWQHLLLAQDSGTDIKGPGRADIFFGNGTIAEQEAGHMHQPGTLYVLLPRPTQEKALKK